MPHTLEPGEKQLSTHNVELIEAAKAQFGELVLTDRRLLVFASPAPTWGYVFGLLGAWLTKLLDREPERASFQIARSRFAAVEEGERKLIVFHDDGEGYAHTSFAIRSKDSFTVWQQRMHAWAAGIDDVVPLPAARVVDL